MSSFANAISGTRLRSRRGFTLVEILVVVALIVLLIALLMPALQNMVERGYRVGCMSNLRQLMHATIMYAGDNRGYLPPPNWNSCDTAQAPGWGYNRPISFGCDAKANLSNGAIWPYTGNISVYRCPMHGPHGGGCNGWGCEAEATASYVTNGAFNNYGDCNMRHKIFNYRADAILMWEGGEDPNLTGDDICNGNDLSQFPSEGIAYRHGTGSASGAHIACMDGHVEWFPIGTYEAIQVSASPNRLWCNGY